MPVCFVCRPLLPSKAGGGASISFDRVNCIALRHRERRLKGQARFGGPEALLLSRIVWGLRTSARSIPPTRSVLQPQSHLCIDVCRTGAQRRERQAKKKLRADCCQGRAVRIRRGERSTSGDDVEVRELDLECHSSSPRLGGVAIMPDLVDQRTKFGSHVVYAHKVPRKGILRSDRLADPTRRFTPPEPINCAGGVRRPSVQMERRSSTMR